MQVLLLSAQDAMLSRLILRGKAGSEERRRFGKLAFGARKAATTPDEDYMQACNSPMIVPIASTCMQLYFNLCFSCTVLTVLSGSS